MGRAGTMTVSYPIPRRKLLLINHSERVVVVRCAGSGPFTLTVRQVNRLDRVRWWLAVFLRRLAAPVARRLSAWRLSRCDEHRCWRRADPDTEENFYCERHGGLARSLGEA